MKLSEAHNDDMARMYLGTEFDKVFKAMDNLEDYIKGGFTTDRTAANLKRVQLKATKLMKMYKR